MTRLILRPLLISIWLFCAVIVTVLVIKRLPEPSASLIFVQQDHTIGYYDPDFNLTLYQRGRGDDEAWPMPDDMQLVHQHLYVTPRSTQTGVDLFLVSQSSNQILRQLTHIDEFPPAAQRDNGNPLWSPDDRWISFTSSDSPDGIGIFVIHPDGSQLQEAADKLGTYPPLIRWGSVPELNFAGALPFLLISVVGLAGFALRRRSISPIYRKFGKSIWVIGI